MTRWRHVRLAVAALVAGSALAACGETASESGRDDDHGGAEVSGPRLVVTTDDGLLVLERDTLEPVKTLPAEGFVRVNAAGDARHVFVSTEEGFRLLDTGVEAEAHGDHAHYRTKGEPAFGETYEAAEPGHVTISDGRTVLFGDGDGSIRVLDSEDPTKVVETTETPDPHHGVAVNLGGDLMHTEGTADARSTVVLRDGVDGDEKARTDDCPGVHGEATAADGRAVVGCEDGVVVVDHGTITKVSSPDAYGRIGNQAGSPESSVVLGDYKVDADAELERPERISLIDTETAKLRLVDLGTSYTFRSLGRGPAGEALVLGTDGALHVIDPVTGKVADRIVVIDPWQEPLDWQRPRPTLEVDGDTAWVTEPGASTVHEVDLAAGRVTRSVELPGVPNEIVSAGAH
ncbi:hypothetical protein IDH50_05035 [Aeromicrobium tamlense]|uniref:Small secreted protein n=1 Tax=Aeromicrobium tamlense TaxID=375541 RepID=A0A8I0KL32_9ACTN|nr:hypothetical protein [Aeromicrobium tamlense]MBD1269588.1 hypothetical protein [Aeromicrobium tamlense]NYI39757.1 putative small secreted protein [Aeromicrobium tamlense]